MPTLRVNDVDLHYETAGEGAPLLFLHGLGSSTRDWEFQMAEFAQTYRVIAVDMRGHGRSAKPPGPYSVKLFAEDTAALLRALEAVPAHIVGISMGGMIAFQLAVDSPETVRSLVIVNSGPAMILRTFSQRMLVRSRFAIIRLFGMGALGRIVAGPLFPKPEQAQLRRRFMAQIGGNDPRAYRDSLRALIGWSVADRIAQIRCPVLVVASDHDYTPVEGKRLYASRIPGAVVAVLKDSRHAAPMDQAEQFNHIVSQFLAAQSPSMPIESLAG